MYVLIADAYALVDFVRFMQVQGLLDSGEYVVIALEKEETYNPDKEYQFIRRGKTHKQVCLTGNVSTTGSFFSILIPIVAWSKFVELTVL